MDETPITPTEKTPLEQATDLLNKVENNNRYIAEHIVIPCKKYIEDKDYATLQMCLESGESFSKKNAKYMSEIIKLVSPKIESTPDEQIYGKKK